MRGLFGFGRRKYGDRLVMRLDIEIDPDKAYDLENHIHKAASVCNATVLHERIEHGPLTYVGARQMELIRRSVQKDRGS